MKHSLPVFLYGMKKSNKSNKIIIKKKSRNAFNPYIVCFLEKSSFQKNCTFWFLCNLELENRNKQTKAKTEK